MATLNARFSTLLAAAPLVIGGLAATLPGACGTESSDPAPTSTPRSAPPASAPLAPGQESDRSAGPSLLLVTVDSARADRIGAWGYAAARTPNLDQLAERGARFTRAYAQVPWSLPAHASILTGTYPPEHGLHDNGRGALNAELTTLAKIFREKGLRTGAFIASLPLDHSFGLDRGFDVYDDDLGNQIGTRGQAIERKGGTVVDSALTWLNRSDRPFFAWVHLTDPCLRHEPPTEFVMDDPYNGEIAYVDAQVGRLGEWLSADPAWENTLFVVVASHGESLGEKGETAHGSFIYEGTQHIPLVISWPGRLAGKRVVDDLVSQVDILPTVLDLFQWPPLEQASGRSLAPLLRGEELEPRNVYLESDYNALSFGWSTLRGVVGKRWKYIQAPTPELYDLTADPGEANNLAEKQPEVVASLAAELDRLRAGMTLRPAESPRVPPDQTQLLFQLNLTLSMGRGVVGEPGVGINPIERIEFLELYHDALRSGHLLQRDRMDEPVRKLISDYPDVVAGHLLRGELDILAGRFDAARGEHQMAVDLDPVYATAHLLLARAYQSLSAQGEAMVHYQIVVELEPENVLARQPLARLLEAQKDIPGALEQYREIVKYRPDQARHWVNLANLARHEGHWKEVAEALKNATDLEPENWNNVNYYAWILATAPDAEARDGRLAVEVAERLEQNAGGSVVVLDTLSAAYAESGRWGRAQDTAREALAVAQNRKNAQQIQDLTARLALYMEEKAYHETQ